LRQRPNHPRLVQDENCALIQQVPALGPAQLPGGQGAALDTGLLLKPLSRLTRQGSAYDAIAGGFPDLARRRHHRRLPRACAPDNGSDPLTTSQMFNGRSLFAREPFMLLEDRPDNGAVDTKTPALGKPPRLVCHFRFDADHGARGVARAENFTRVEIDSLTLEAHDLGVLENAGHDPVEDAGTVDVAMHDLGEIALIEHTSFPADHVEDDGRFALDLLGRLPSLRLEQTQTIKLCLATPTLGLLLDRLSGDTDMDGWRYVDTALSIRTSIDANVMAVQREMLVLSIVPRLSKAQEIVLVTSPEPIGDLS
jgi:hypothetical protein